MSSGNFSEPRALASSTTSVMSTGAPASCNGVATTRPASLMSKYFAPQRWMLYKLRAARNIPGLRGVNPSYSCRYVNERTIGCWMENSIRVMKKVCVGFWRRSAGSNAGALRLGTGAKLCPVGHPFIFFYFFTLILLALRHG